MTKRSDFAQKLLDDFSVAEEADGCLSELKGFKSKGCRWAQIAKHLPGRTDNEVKNFWNSCVKKKLLSQGLDPKTHNLLSLRQRASNKVAYKYPSSSQSQQSSFTVFNINSQARDTNNTVMMNVHVVTFPDNQTMAMQIPSFEPQNPNASYAQNLNESAMYPYAVVETFEESRVEDLQPPQQQQQKKEKICEIENDMDVSLVSDSLHLGLLESTLMSAAMHRDLSAMDDFGWNF
ncbi:Detected protein of unknown function [Hibiscus syriacus]|uniref:Uncharacterized protein n=1 Tax=Hibiscus syriacus TaxID=106335 RepID=A0A6A3A474_HIBSY|nr:Detected protein of unknown function [Hibiscus syriacus]